MWRLSESEMRKKRSGYFNDILSNSTWEEGFLSILNLDPSSIFNGAIMEASTKIRHQLADGILLIPTIQVGTARVMDFSVGLSKNANDSFLIKNLLHLK